MNKMTNATQGSALMMALMIVGAVGAITALSVIVARNETLGSQTMAQETLQRTGASGDNQLPMGALQMALPPSTGAGL